MGEFTTIGIVGLVLIGLLFLISVWKTGSLILDSREYIIADPACRKRILLQFMLVLSVACDLPMYIAFTVTGDYSLVSYSFHKFSSAFLFAGYSMTIYDWSAVLYDIKELDHRPLFFRRNSLIVITILMFIMSAINFIYMFTTSGVNSYINSPLYVANIFLQIIASFVLTGMMLSAGLRLSIRIRGVCGELGDSINMPSSYVMSQANSVKGLQSALNRLNLVMFVCFSCILCQMVLLICNYALGYSNQTGKTVGPTYFYWTFYFWLPVWGPVCALMYLGRSNFHKKDAMFGDVNTYPTNNFNYSYGASYGVGRMTGSLRKTISGLQQINAGSVISGEDESSRPTVYRPPDYPSALFSRDSAYQYDEDGIIENGSDMNENFDTSTMNPVLDTTSNGSTSEYVEDYLQSPEIGRIPFVSVDRTATSSATEPNRSVSKTVSTNTEMSMY